MKPFMNEDFLLSTPTAKALFSACKDEPIFDWHCHLSPKEILDNEKPANISRLWLGGDHYKWRAMRSCGVDESYITGDKSDKEKFLAWAQCMPKLIGNPLYHWTHLELQRYFGIDKPLSPATAEEIWEETSKQIEEGDFRPRALIARSNVKALCTTDDPADTLDCHAALRDDPTLPFKVLPAFRPDKALNVEAPAFLPWLSSLEAVVKRPVASWDDFKAALSERIARFADLGCRATDHALNPVPYRRLDDAALDAVLSKVRAGQKLTPEETEGWKTELMLFLAGEYSQRGWAMELHLGAMRNNNARMFRRLGPDTGYDSMDDQPVANKLSRLLDAMNEAGGLPKTILFCLNPKDNYVLGTMLGNFQSEEAYGKLQFGSGWWFNDNISGMRAQMDALANLGALSTFVGMVTDSRSFLSYPRHEYFRRILCEYLGGLVENGEYPEDLDTLSQIVKDISFGNANRYFGLDA